MADFIKRPISLDQDSIGIYVKKIRERRKINLADISSEINVSLRYLEAIESGSYKDLPKGIYSKIFFKKYIEYLGIRHKNIVNDFVKEQNRNQNFESNIFFNRVVDWKNLLSLPKIIKNILISALILIIFIYLYVYFRNIFAPPFLEIDNPKNNEIINIFSINVSGLTEAESELKINGQLILINKDGAFNEDVHLKSGVNVITISSKKKYSKEKIEIRQILVEN